MKKENLVGAHPCGRPTFIVNAHRSKQTRYIFIAIILVALQTVIHPSFAQLSCPTAAFLDVQPDPANGAYPAPELSVTCGTTSFTVASNGIPNYEFVQTTPNDLQAQTYSWDIPLTPSGAQEDIPLLGTTGVLVNGIPIFGPNEAANLGFGDPFLDGILDFCNGHTGRNGTYHNHAPPECIFADYQDNVGLVVGYSLDGWPILAPFECADSACNSVVELQSSWQLIDASVEAAWDKHSYVAGSGDLDQCNGKVQPDGTYAYYATATFPYFSGCYINSDFTATPANTPVPTAIPPTNDTIVSAAADITTATINDIITVDITAVNAPDPVHGFEFTVTYDPNTVTFTSGVSGGWIELTGRSLTCSPHIEDGNKITVACVTVDEGCTGVTAPSGDGTLYTMQFTAVADGTTPITLGSVMLQGDTSTAEIPVNSTNDTAVTVGSDVPTAVVTDTIKSNESNGRVPLWFGLIGVLFIASLIALLTRRRALFAVLMVMAFAASALPILQAQGDDVTAVAAQYGCVTSDACYDGANDTNNDGEIDLLDMIAVANAHCAAPTEEPPSDNQPQNVLLIIADDYGIDMATLYDAAPNTSTPSTPNIDALRDSGVLFTNAWVNPTCTPTRATLLTGQYGFRTGMGAPPNPQNGQAGIDQSIYTLPRALDAGSNSMIPHANIGKWHLSTGRDGNMSPNNMGWSHYSGTWQNVLQDYSAWTKTVNGVDQQVTTYATTENVNDAISWMGANSGDNRDEPWFLWVAFYAPHTPFHLPPTDLHSYDTLSGTADDIDANPEPYYFAMVEAMDTEIGRLLNAIPAAERDHTTVIFMGDNGTPGQVSQQPFARRGLAKGSLNEGGIHVPFIVSSPLTENPGRDNNALINGVDMFATVLDLTETTADVPVDSVSFAPYLTDSTASNQRDFAYSELFNNGGNDGRTIRNEAYKLLLIDGQPEQLFDLTTDPYALTDLISTGLDAPQQTNYCALHIQLRDLIATEAAATQHTIPAVCQ